MHLFILRLQNIEITDTYLHIYDKIQKETARKIERVVKDEEKK